MKITIWNVNGLRAAIGKGMLDWISQHTADILCLQEVRARPEQLDPQSSQALVERYPHLIWNPAERPGYSDVVTLARTAPEETWLGLEDDRFDDEGRVIASRHPGFLLYNIYFPNGGQDNGRVPYKLDLYARLLEICDVLHKQDERVILDGDFNTSHRPIDLKNPKLNEKNTGFLPEEREWIEKYLKHCFVDFYRQLCPERTQYTWWTYQINARAKGIDWRLDYFLVSEELAEAVQDVVIHDEVMGSDHCPVTLELRELPK